MQSFEIFMPLGLLDLSLLYCNVRSRFRRPVVDSVVNEEIDLEKRKTEIILREQMAIRIENYLSLLIFILSFSSNPSLHSVEMGRLQCVMQMSNTSSLFRKDVFPFVKQIVDVIVKKIVDRKDFNQEDIIQKDNSRQNINEYVGIK